MTSGNDVSSGNDVATGNDVTSGNEATRRRHGLSVRTRAALVASLVMLAASVLGGIVLVRVVSDRLIAADRTAARLRAADVLALATARNLPPHLSFPGEETGATQVLRADGAVLASTGNLEGDRPISGLRPEAGETASEIRTIHAIDDTQRYVLVAVTSEHAPHVTVLSATSLESSEATIATLRRSLLIGLPFLVLVVGVTTRILVGRALRPVAAITEEVSDITLHGLQRRVPQPATADEIEELARTMNKMLERLEAASDRQRRFVADASHELRSPLASARATLEVAALHPGSRQDLVAAIGSALVDHDRLDRLTLDLLQLARLDDPRHVVTTDASDVDDLLRSLIERRPEGSIDMTLDAGVQRVDGQGLTRIVTNLLDNAARHRSSRTIVTADVRDRYLVVEVGDDGPGIPPGDRTRVFEPFTRLDEARVADEGTGLGLAIVHDLVVGAGGTVSVGTSDAGGASVTVRLPV